MAYMRRIAIAAALLALVACGGSPTASPTASTSPPATITPSSSPSFPSPTPSGPTPPAPATVKCSSPIAEGATLALVTLRNTKGVIVRDLSDVSKPVSRCVITGAGANFFRFVNVNHISYIVTSSDGAGALYLVALATQRTTLVRSWTNEGSLYWVYAWSPDGSMLTYLSSNGDKVAWHLLSAAGDVKLSDLGSIPGRGVDANNDDAMVGFSAEGKYVALENTFSNATGAAKPFQIVRLADNKLVYSRTNGTMATWGSNGATFYFRTTVGVEAWDAAGGTTRTVVPQGFRWIHPSTSADGNRIAYVDLDGKGNHFPGYVQLADGQAFRVSSRPRTHAAFLTSTLMWYAEETVACTQCDTVPQLTGRTYIYDVVAKTESASIITALFDSWPHSV